MFHTLCRRPLNLDSNWKKVIGRQKKLSTIDKMSKLTNEKFFILVKMISSPETNDFLIGGSSNELLLLSMGYIIHVAHIV